MPVAGPAGGGYRLLRIVLALAALAGCTAPPPDFVAAGFVRQDDPACRLAAEAAAEQRAEARSGVVLAAEAGAGPIGTSSAPPSAARAVPVAVPGRCFR